MPQLTLIVKRENSQSESRLSFRAGESLLLLCRKNGIEITSPCGGKGICGKCKVRFLSGAPIPKPSERKYISAEELRNGYRLACMAVPAADCAVLLPEIQNANVIGSGISVLWELCGPDRNRMASENGNDITTETKENAYFVTADIGTTTVIMEKRRIRDGKIIAVYRALNAQKKYGADVLLRMEASVDGHKEELSGLIRDQLMRGLHKLESGKESNIQFIVIAANTPMIHLLMGYDVEALSKAPFVPQTLDEIETEIGGIKTYIMPGISAFVGADLTAGMYAVDYLKRQENEKDYVNLLIDLGTNAEMILFDDKKAVCTSAAAGCAFDSIAEAGVYGADVVAILAGLLKNGAIDGHGTLRDDLFDSGVIVEVQSGKPETEAEDSLAESAKMVCITQEQIRQMQLAKAAVRCGIDYLTEKFGCRIEDISQVYLAGGFGYYLDADAAVTVGLLPETFRNITYSCGNAALVGAAVYAKEVNYVNQEHTIRAVKNPRAYQAFNLAEQPDFSQRYISYLDF